MRRLRVRVPVPGLLRLLAFPALAVLVLPGALAADDGGVTFDNIADDGVGLEYARVRSPEFATVRQFQLLSLERPLTLADRSTSPR